jgi:hypothetical protein
MVTLQVVHWPPEKDVTLPPPLVRVRLSAVPERRYTSVLLAVHTVSPVVEFEAQEFTAPHRVVRSIGGVFSQMLPRKSCSMFELTDDGQPPLDAAGLRLQERLQAIQTSIERVGEKRGSPAP